MKLIGEIVKSEANDLWPPMKIFHIRLVKGRRRFGRERIVERHIGKRPWSEMFFVDDEGHVHEVFAK